MKQICVVVSEVKIQKNNVEKNDLFSIELRFLAMKIFNGVPVTTHMLIHELVVAYDVMQHGAHHIHYQRQLMDVLKVLVWREHVQKAGYLVTWRLLLTEQSEQAELAVRPSGPQIRRCQIGVCLDCHWV